MTSFRRFLALFLLVWMPLQALAVPLLEWHCASPERAGTVGAEPAAWPCQSHEAPSVADRSQGGGQPDETPAQPAGSGDLCCSHISAVAPTLRVASVGRMPFEAPVPTLPAFSFLSRPLTQPPRS